MSRWPTSVPCRLLAALPAGGSRPRGEAFVAFVVSTDGQRILSSFGFLGL